MALPTMTPEQRTAALAKAAEVRAARSELMAAVKSGAVDAVDLLDRQDELAKRTKVVSVLRALPGWGKVKVSACLDECGIDESRRLGGLTAAQRERLRDALR
jgi:hypothetical protein